MQFKSRDRVGCNVYRLPMENEGLYQTVSWNKATPHQKAFGLPLTKQDADRTLEIAKRTGHIDGKVVPYRTEPGHYPK